MMIAPPEWLLGAAEPWATLYSDSAPVRIVVLSLHLVPLLLGGGVAIATDRSTLQAGRGGLGDACSRQLVTLGAVHRWIGIALTFTIVSGVLLLLSDLEQFFGSVVYWTKMGLVVALLVNGLAMMRAERALAPQAGGAGWEDAAPEAWRKLERSARTSFVLWVLITIAGVALVNGA
jgi:hypothetical protein